MLETRSKNISIVVADTQFLITEALASIIKESNNYFLAGIISDTDELKTILPKLNPNVLIIDIISMNMDGFDELFQIKNQYPTISIVILTNLLSKAEFTRLNKAGVKTILYKTADKDELFHALDLVIQGRKYFCAEVLDLMLEIQDRKKAPEEHTLTPSEIDIVRLIADGLTTKEIAGKKNISFHTVMTHRKNIFRKLNINNASELLMYSMKAGLIDNLEYYI